MPSFSWVTTLLLVLAWSAAAYWAGDHNRDNAWLALQGKQERQAKEALEEAQFRGDGLSRELFATQQQIDQLKTEKLHALSQATTGRPCLNAPTLRLLDQAPGLSVSGLPPATSGTAAASEPVSTDTDIAQWAADAGARFEVCRTRLDALIGWHTP